MALSTATITYDLANLSGVVFDARRTKVWANTNVPGDSIVDTVADKIRLGCGDGTIAANGTGSIEVWVPGTGSNPASWQTWIHVDYPDRHGRASRTFGPFTITASANLADLVAEIPIPAPTLSHTHSVSDLTATGTKDATTFLRGDNTWAVPAGGGGGGSTVASGITFTPTGTIAATNVQTAVAEVASEAASDATTKANAAQAAAVQRANHTGTQAQSTVTNLTTDLAAKAPTANPTFTGTVSGVTKAHVGLGNVDNTSDANKPVSTAQGTAIDTAADNAADTATGYADLYKAPIRATINAQTGTTYTIVLADENKLVTCSNTGAITVTLPQDSTVAIPVGGRVDFAVLNTGMVTFVAGSGATVNGTPSLVTRARYSAASAIKVAANNWLVVGDLL